MIINVHINISNQLQLRSNAYKPKDVHIQQRQDHIDIPNKINLLWYHIVINFQ